MSLNDFYKDLLAFMKRLRKEQRTTKYDTTIRHIEQEFKTKRRTNEPIEPIMF